MNIILIGIDGYAISILKIVNNFKINMYKDNQFLKNFIYLKKIIVLSLMHYGNLKLYPLYS